LRSIDAPVIWLDDRKSSVSRVQRGDLVLSVGIASAHLPMLEGVYYCLHNFDDSVHRRLDPAYNLRLQVYTIHAEHEGRKWDAVTVFDQQKGVLYQPWGTDLLGNEFCQPIHSRIKSMSFWVGSVWDNEQKQGNVIQVAEMKRALRKNGIIFIPLRGVPDVLHRMLIRLSAVAPAIGGKWQVDNDYLPCRMFKNISYGQLGISNIRKFRELFGDEISVHGSTIDELIDSSLSIRELTRREMIAAQQEIVLRHTYVHKLKNILIALELVAQRTQ